MVGAEDGQGGCCPSVLQLGFHGWKVIFPVGAIACGRWVGWAEPETPRTLGDVGLGRVSKVQG